MRYVLLFVMVLLSANAEAQVSRQQGQNNNYYQQQNMQGSQNYQGANTKMNRSFISSNGNQGEAFNLMVVQEVATYKLGDETLQKEIEGLRNNQEYYNKLEKIRRKLSNAKLSDSKNKEVMRILNDAGRRINNLLGN